MPALTFAAAAAASRLPTPTGCAVFAAHFDFGIAEDVVATPPLTLRRLYAQSHG